MLLKKYGLAAVAAVMMAVGARGMFMNSTVKVPVERVVANVEAWIKEKPADAQAQYVLGRIHAMAWAYGAELSLWRTPQRGGRDGAPAGGDADPFAKQLPGFAPYDAVQVQRRDGATKVTAEDAKHLAGAIEHYKKACEMDGTKAIYELGLAWILQETGKVAADLPADFGGAAKPTAAEAAAYDAAIKKLGDADATVREEATKVLVDAMPKPSGQLAQVKSDDAEVRARVERVLKEYWSLQALEHYRKAYAINVKADLARPGTGPQANSNIAAEAGEAVLAILKESPGAAKPGEVAEVTASMKKLRGGPMAMTPVVFAMPGGRQPAGVGDLVNAGARVTFDLAGDRVKREWPWVTPGTALLVWDPMETGDITSGRALFGSRTWWVFFEHGYEALGVLDDDRDGRLTGAELDGIRVWIDANGDGVSDAGEVKGLASVGIDAIGVSATRDADGTLVSEAGVHFVDGRTVKTFDWVARPVESGAAAR